MYAAQLDFENKLTLESNVLKLKEKLESAGAPAIEPPPFTFEVFSRKSLDERTRILSNISTYLQILSQEFDYEIERNPRIHEIARLKWSLKCFGLKPKSQDVFSIVNHDDVIEVYNINGVQLYRNMLFFKMCSYSLLDLSVHSWDMLYDKPSSVMETTYKIIDQMFSNPPNEPIAYGIPSYLQKEKFEFSKYLKTLKVMPKYIVPLFDHASGRPAGAFSTYHAEILAEGDQSDRFTII